MPGEMRTDVPKTLALARLQSAEFMAEESPMGDLLCRGTAALIPGRFMRAPLRVAMSGWGPGPDRSASFWLGFPGTQLSLRPGGLAVSGSAVAAAFLTQTLVARDDVLEVRAITKSGRMNSRAGLAVLTRDTPWLAIWSHQLGSRDEAVDRLAEDGYPVAATTSWQRDFGGLIVDGSPYWQR